MLCILFIAAKCFAQTFGVTTIGGTVEDIKDKIFGLVADMTSDVDQRADSITVYLRVADISKNVKCALYDNASPDRVLIAQTEERQIPISEAWQTFSFVDPPLLVADQEYLITVWMQAQTGYGQARRAEVSADFSLERKTLTYNGYPDLLTGAATGPQDVSIYVTFGLGVTRIYGATIYDATIH